jgi:hypothetical protein
MITDRPTQKCKLNNLKFLWGGHLARPVSEVERYTGYSIRDLAYS